MSELNAASCFSNGPRLLKGDRTVVVVIALLIAVLIYFLSLCLCMCALCLGYISKAMLSRCPCKIFYAKILRLIGLKAPWMTFKIEALSLDFYLCSVVFCIIIIK